MSNPFRAEAQEIEAGGRRLVAAKLTSDERIALDRMAREGRETLSSVIRSGLAREYAARRQREHVT
jgi:hypothetical protein